MNKNTVSALSQKEAEIVARLSYEEKDIVTAQELDSYLPVNFQYRKQLVYSLKKKRILIPIKRGVYIFVPLESVPTGRRVSEFLIPPVFFIHLLFITSLPLGRANFASSNSWVSRMSG